MRNAPRIKLVLVSVVVAAAVGIGMLRPSIREPEPAPVGPLEKVTIGAEGSMLTAAIWVAQEQGLFEKEGLDVTIRKFDSGRLSFLAMLDGDGIDISTVAPTPIMFKSFERDDFAIFATFVYSFDDVKVIASKARGIGRAADLKGKKSARPRARPASSF